MLARAAVLLIIAAPVSAVAVEEIVDATKDAEIRQNNPDGNWGTDFTLDVRAQRNPSGLLNRRALVGFDFTGGEFLGCTVDAATFQMYLEDTNASRTYDVNPLSGAWVETTVTWNIAAGLTAGPLASSANVTDGTEPTPVSWTGLAGLVQAAIDGETELTLRVKDSIEPTVSGNPPQQDNAIFTSREGAADAEAPPDSFPPRLVIDVSCDECETWVDETAWSDGERYQDPGNWATYTTYVADSTVTLFAGQFYDAGSVHFSSPDDGDVTITITLNAGFRFADVLENVKVQGYEIAPSGNPAPGLFDNKETADPGDISFEIVVPVDNFYGVHVDLERCADDDV
jgi:hypothetical protein